MKKLSLLISLAIATSLLLSSCSRLKDISISKRHYRSGYTVDFGVPQQDVKTVNSNPKSVTIDPPSSGNTITDNKSSINTQEKNKEVTLKKDNLDSAPSNIISREETKKDKHKTTTGNVYASKDNSAITAEIKSEVLDNQNTKLSKAITDSSGSSSETPDWLLIVFCIILPPLAVGLKFGIIDKFWISCLLTLLFWIPGVIYALIVVTQK